MGKKSREKRQRREQDDDDPIADLIASYSTESIVTLLEAASVSPTSSHRGPSLAVLFQAVMRRRRDGDELAGGDALTWIVDGVGDLNSSLRHLEDFQPYEGRDEILVPWGGELFRMLPGAMERPTQMVRQHEFLASVIDPFIVKRMGFGLMDVGELLLRRIDHVARVLSTGWPTGPAAEVGDPATVSEMELAAARSIAPTESLINDCRSPEAARRALKHYTVASAKLAADVTNLFTTATFGRAVAVARHGKVTALPVGLLPEVIPAIGVDLASLAAELDPDAALFWRNLVGNRIGRLLQGSGHKISGPARLPGRPPFHSLVWFDDRRVMVIGNGSSLIGGDKQQRLDDTALLIQRVRSGAVVQTPGGDLQLPDDAQVLHVLVTAGPQHSGPIGLTLPTLGLDDLEWIVYSESQHDDLWYFIRDLTHTPNVGRRQAWDLIDQWEVWQPRKSFYRGAEDVTLMTFAAHAAVAEWNDAAKSARVERALHQLKMRPLRDWPLAEITEDGADVADITTDEITHIATRAVPTGVDRVDPTGPQRDAEILRRLSIDLDWKIRESADVFVTAARRSGLDAVRVRFAFTDRTDGPALSVHDVDIDNVGQLTISWDGRLEMMLAEDSFAVEANLGRVVADVFAPAERAAFIEAWDAAPPGIRVDGYNVEQRARNLPEPLTAHEALGEDMLREVAAVLKEAGMAAGEYVGTEATALESRTIFPWLIAALHSAMANFAAENLLVFATAQLECANAQRFILDRRLAWERGFPTGGTTHTSSRRDRSSKAVRVLSLLVEEIVANPPTGTAVINDTTWEPLLVIAELCIESCLRSEEIHRRLQNTAVSVSDSFELTVENRGGPTDVDFSAFAQARASAIAPTGIPIATGQHVETEHHPDDLEPRSTVELLPELAPIDDAMRHALGFGIDAVTGALNVGTQWEVSDHSPVIRATRDAIADACVESTRGATRSEYLAALDWLTLRPSDLLSETIPHWEIEHRARRIATCPYIQAGDGAAWVLPWTTGATIKVFANYLQDGRLPWPSTALPRAVDLALHRYRQGKNTQLERDIEDALRVHGLEVRGSIRPAKRARYGLSQLSGEIDILCVDTNRSRIWVIEAKDPYLAFSARQIRRQIDDFHKTGGYIDKLLRKVVDVEESAADVASALAVDRPDRTWTLIGLAVTRRVDAAAFAVDSRIPFCTVDDVLAVVDNDTPPHSGFNRAGH